MVLQKNQITDTYIWVHPDQYPLWARPDYIYIYTPPVAKAKRTAQC